VIPMTIRRPNDRQSPIEGHRSRSGIFARMGFRVLIYCSTGLCHQSAIIDADGWPDDTVLLEPESLTGAQWR
jgi:hypothetical protein